MIRRRQFLALLGTVVGCQATAQSIARPLVAILEGTSPDIARYYLEPFEQVLREQGRIEERTIEIARRFADGDAARFPALAEQLVQLRPAVIVTGSTTGAIACKRLTSTIPIVSPNLTDPVGAGLITSLARPGGNVTGIVISLDGQPGKLLELLVEFVPRAKRIGLLVNPSERANARQRQLAEGVAAGMGLTLITAEVRSRDEFATAFQSLSKADVQALYVPSSLLWRTERSELVKRALAAGLPVICNAREIAEAGALMSYGADLRENYRRAAYFVDRILKGARPADLPTENPRKFVLSINLKTAKALSLSVPPALLALADEVIE